MKRITQDISHCPRYEVYGQVVIISVTDQCVSSRGLQAMLGKKTANSSNSVIPKLQFMKPLGLRELLCKICRKELIIANLLPVVLYGCETWSLTLREKHRLRVFENRVLRRIFGPKRNDVTGD
jgi:hypothetical protein